MAGVVKAEARVNVAPGRTTTVEVNPHANVARAVAVAKVAKVAKVANVVEARGGGTGCFRVVAEIRRALMACTNLVRAALLDVLSIR